MAFINPLPKNPVISIGDKGLGGPRPPSFPLSGRQFGDNLNKLIRLPGVNFNTQINLNMGKSSNDNGSSSSKDNGDNNSPPSNGGKKKRQHGRPHNREGQKGFYPIEVKGTSEVAFNSGIKSGTFINPLRESTSENAVLFTLCGSFLPDISQVSISRTILDTNLYFSYLTKIQSEISYKVTQYFTKSQFREYISHLIAGLELYYNIDSVLAFNMDSNNNNPGMRYLRSRLTADVLSQFELLRQCLVQCAIPPNLLSFISYMYQNFRFDNTDNSPIFRISFRLLFHNHSVQSINADYISTIISEIQKHSTVITVMRRTFPSFCVSEMPPSSVQPLFCKNFMAFWYNSDCTYIDHEGKELNHTRYVSGPDQPIPYSHFSDVDVDGIFYASTSIFNTYTKISEPGFWVPYSNFTALDTIDHEAQKTNLLAYNSHENMLLAPMSQYVAVQSGLQDSVYYDDKQEKEKFQRQYSVNPASQIVQTNSINNTLQALSQSIIFLFGGID